VVSWSQGRPRQFSVRMHAKPLSIPDVRPHDAALPKEVSV
jgi:hypothetical protein